MPRVLPALIVALLAAAPASARPGPAVLHRPLAHAPQLSNTGIWKAKPILVSGTSAYRRGEFLYQDFLYDDDGTYPTGRAFASRDDADLVEVRLKLTATGTAFRITYNAMDDPTAVGTTIALGDSPQPRPLPHATGVSEPAQVFVSVHATQAQATGGAQLSATVDRARKQVQVVVPFSVFDPRGQTAVRVAVAAGVWDGAVFNAAFRYHEPGTGFRDTAQQQALSDGDLSPFSARVDFTKLAARVTDDSGVPRTGFMDRIYASHFHDTQGRGDAQGDTEIAHAPGCAKPCVWQYAGQLQPYEIYVPTRPGPYGLTLDLHGCDNPYNFDYATQRQQQLANRAFPSIVVSGEARGQCYWYYGEAGADPFEIWADVAHRYPLDPRHAAISGLSMGGFGAYKLAAQFPDLFAGAAPVVPCPSAGVAWAPGADAPGGEASALIHMVPALRSVPVMAWHSPSDELCVDEGAEHQQAIADTLDALGYTYAAWTFGGLEHDTLAEYAQSQSQPLADFLGARRVPRDPAHVTYVLNATMDEPAYGLNADHAYWLSGLRRRHGTFGRIDATTHGLGAGEPGAGPTQRGMGLLSGPVALPYVSQARTRGTAPPAARQDRLDLTTTNVAAATVDAKRAGLSCHPDVRANGSLRLTIRRCGRRHRRTVVRRVG